MHIRFLVALLLLTPVVSADPLFSCPNIGGAAYQTTPPTYSISGTTYNICAGCPDGETFADVNALSLSPGDAVLFRAGETFVLSSESNRMAARSGVLYGRYGTGPNPLLQGAPGLTFSVTFRGIFEADAVSDVTVDGIDLEGSPSFGYFFRDCPDCSLSNSTVGASPNCNVCFIRSDRAVVDKNVIFGNGGGAHESLTFGGSMTDYVASNNRIFSSRDAAINNKNGPSNGEIYGNELHTVANDPTLYCADGCSNTKIHDNWIHDAVGNYKGLFTFGTEQTGVASSNNEAWNNVIHTTNKHAIRFWMRFSAPCPTTGPDNMVVNNHIHHNTIYDTGNSGNAWDYALMSIDDRDCGADPQDWSGNVIENNIFWSTDNADAINFGNGTGSGFTVRYNLFETGETDVRSGSTLGTNVILTSSAPFVDLAGMNFDPAGAALGAGSDGSDVGANITWTCGLGSDPDPPTDPPPATLIPLQTAKPDPYTIDNLETHYPDHLWVMSDLTAGTTMEDEGGGVACDLTNNGAASATDAFGKSFLFTAGELDYMQGACTDWPATTGVMCAVFLDSTFPATNQTIASWGDASDAIMVAATSIQGGTGNAVAGLCEPGSCGGHNNIGPWSVIDGNANMVCVRQSATQNDIWMNGSGWQTRTVSATTFSWGDMDQFTIGALGRAALSEYVGGKIFTVFTYDGVKTDAEMDTIWNNGDPWSQIGIDPSAGGEPIVVPAGNRKLLELGPSQ